jgi:hypothetical protein
MKVYLGASKGISFFPSKLIKWRQWGFPYTHIFHIGPKFPENPNNPFVIEAWNNGMVSGFMSERHTPGTEFTIFSYEASEEQAEVVEKYLHNAIGTKYDWWGIIGFMSFSKTMESKKRLFCSESEFTAPLTAGIKLLNFTIPSEVSPRLFLKSTLLKKEGDYKLKGKN